jgi:hypothetical protein
MSETINGVTYREHALLLGFLTKGEADAIFAQNPLRLRTGISLSAAHQEARAGLAGLQAYAAGTAAPLPAALATLAQEVRERDLYKKEYEAKADYVFASLEIDSLLAPQMNIDLEYVQELADRLPTDPNDADDFAFSFPTGEIAEPIVKGNTVVFTSHAPNIAVSAVPVLRRTSQGFAVMFEAKSRPNYVMVARVNGRLILHNGVHKVLALRARGRMRTFAVMHDLQQQSQLGLGQGGLSMFAEANYTQSGRPPLVKDFVGPAAVSVLTRATVNVYRLMAQTEEVVAPALTS